MFFVVANAVRFRARHSSVKMPVSAEQKARMAADRAAAREEVARRRALDAEQDAKFAVPPRRVNRPAQQPEPRSRAESQSALDADIEEIRTTPRSTKPKKAPVAASGPDSIPGNPLKCNPDREPTDSGFAQQDRVVHATRGAGTVLGFFGEFVMVQYDNEPHGRHKYTWSKAQRSAIYSVSLCLCDIHVYTRCLIFSNGKDKAVAAKHRTRKAAEEDDDDYTEEPSPSPIRAKPPSKIQPAVPVKAPESYSQNGTDILGIGGGDDNDDGPAEREETDSGFAQWDRVKHTKRGLGRVIGFFGEFVMVQFDDEPHGRHKYTWDQAKKKVSIIGWQPPEEQA